MKDLTKKEREGLLKEFIQHRERIYKHVGDPRIFPKTLTLYMVSLEDVITRIKGELIASGIKFMEAKKGG